MEDIRKIFTIQWVGPFTSFASLKSYLDDPDTCDKSLFSFYYCSGSKKGKGYPLNRNSYRYFGIHKASSSIDKRVSPWHEHLKEFRVPFSLWIGSFSNIEQQTPQNAEDVETIFISTYKNLFSENVCKKKSSPKESICIINLWYKPNETTWRRKKEEIKLIDDVLVYEAESQSYLRAILSRRSI